MGRAFRRCLLVLKCLDGWAGNIHRTSAQGNIEHIAAERIYRSDRQKQKRRLPLLRCSKKLGSCATPRGTTDAIPSSTPTKRSLAPTTSGIVRSWKERYTSVIQARVKPNRSGAKHSPLRFGKNRYSNKARARAIKMLRPRVTRSLLFSRWHNAASGRTQRRR